MIGPSRIIFQETSSDSEQEPLQPQPIQNIYSEQNVTLQPSYQHEPEPKYQAVLDTYANTSYYDLGIPVSSFATLRGHTKGVSCVAVEPKGHRMATGGLDYHVRLWDFHGMNSNLNSFRIIEPFTGNAIRNLDFNLTGSHLMILNGGKQITMLDRDGARNMLTVKGYMYIKELHGTKGHTNTIYDGHFHPLNANEFVSASGDGSIRLWDLEQKLEGIEQELAHKVLLKCKDARSVIVGITGVNYTANGKMVVGGCMDGSLQVWSTTRNHHRPEMVVREAHMPREEYTTILSYNDSQRIITRNTDHMMKVWDLRMFEKPMAHYSHMLNYFPGSKVCMSPDQRYLVVGTSIGEHSDEKEAYLHFFDSTTLEKIKTMNVGTSSVTGIVWSKVLNQIVVGMANGETLIFFDERLSTRGAIKSLSKAPRIDKDPKFDYSAPVYLPHSLPIYQQRPTNNIKKDLEAIRKNPILSANPHLPSQGPNKYGRDNSVAYTQIQHVVQAINENLEKVDDARKPLWEIQKYTQDAKDYTQAYRETQPKPQFSSDPVERKEYQLLEKIEKICPHCGLKLCTCPMKWTYESEEEEDEDEIKRRL